MPIPDGAGSLNLAALTAEESKKLLQIIHGTVNCDTESGLEYLLEEFRALVPYRSCVGILARNGDSGTPVFYNCLNMGFPARGLDRFVRERFEFYTGAKESLDGSVLESWIDTEHVNMNGFSHWMLDRKKARMSVFFCGGEPGPMAKTRTLLALAMPHLHRALRRVLDFGAHRGTGQSRALSPRETEVLRCLKRGKTSMEIGFTLGISERTVKFHIGNIISKLEAVSRTHAVAVALERNLVQD